MGDFSAPLLHCDVAKRPRAMRVQVGRAESHDGIFHVACDKQYRARHLGTFRWETMVDSVIDQHRKHARTIL